VVTWIDLILNILVTVVFIEGAEKGNRGELSYIGWAGAMVLFAGIFDMLDGQVARMGKMSSSFGALFDSVLDRYSELVLFLGICYYLISHHYFYSSLFAFIAMMLSLMCYNASACDEGLVFNVNEWLTQMPESVITIVSTAIARGITAYFIGGDYKVFLPGTTVQIFETISVFTIPLAIMAVLTNYTAFKRLIDAKVALDLKDKGKQDPSLSVEQKKN